MSVLGGDDGGMLTAIIFTALVQDPETLTQERLDDPRDIRNGGSSPTRGIATNRTS